MSEKYLIIFNPVGRFYFGTSQSFTDSFFARSSKLPTQTMLLGCLRHTLLKQNRLLDAELRYPRSVDDSVKNLTGEAAMKSIMETVNDGNYFGIIKKISPVFICHLPSGHLFPRNFYFPVPYDVVFKRHDVLLDASGKKKIAGIEKIQFEKVSEYYSVKNRTKESTANLFGGDLFWNHYFSAKELSILNTFKEDEIFIEDSQPGIGRKDRQTVKEKYYIKKDYRMHKEFSFGIIAHFSKTPPLENDDVCLGGERSLFRMTLTKIDEKHISVLNSHVIMKRLLSLNDYGDFDGSSKVNMANTSALVFISAFFGIGTIDGTIQCVLNNIYSPRMLQYKGKKTNTFNVIPSRTVIYSSGSLSVNKIFPISKLIGYNFVLKFKTR